MTSPLRKHSLFHLPVETKSGQALGHIDDIELDPMTQQVLRYYVKSGHLVAALLQKELIVAAEQVPEARKLLKLTLSLGGDHRRQVFAGIKAAYEPEQLIGRLVVVVANLKPRQMKFGLSEGMVTAAGPGGEEVFLLNIDDGAKPGQRVH